MDSFRSTSVSWTNDIWAIVESLPKEFSLADVYRHKKNLARKHPQNHHVEAKIRQQLQFLRDEGKIEFIDDAGQYRRR